MDNLEFLNLLALPPKCWDYRDASPHPMEAVALCGFDQKHMNQGHFILKPLLLVAQTVHRAEGQKGRGEQAYRSQHKRNWNCGLETA